MSTGTGADPARALPARPSLRHLKLEAKRRRGAGEFATLHDAQVAIAREHGLPGWGALKQACAKESHALAHLRWLAARFSDADAPGWTPPGEDEFLEHFHDRFLAVIPAATLVEGASKMAADLRGGFTVIAATPFEARIQLAGLRFVAVTDAAPPYRLVGLRGFPLGDRVTEPLVKAPPPVRTAGRPPDETRLARLAAAACAELGVPALVLAGGEPGRVPWVVAAGHADLARSEPVGPGHLFPAPGVTGLVTGTAVLRLVAEGRLDLDAPAGPRLRAVRLADDSVTVRELLSHTAGVGSPAELYADRVPALAELMGPVIPCDGPRGTVWPSNGGYGVLGQLIADVTRLPYPRAAARLVLDPLGMRDSRFPEHAADLGPGMVTTYTATADGAIEPFGAQVCRVQAIAGLWSTAADLVRLATGWASLLPPALARETLTQQAAPGPGGLRLGLGWVLEGETFAYGGTGLEAVALLRGRVRDRRACVVLASRAVFLDRVGDSLRRSWLTQKEGDHVPALSRQRHPASRVPGPARSRLGADRGQGHVRGRRGQPDRHRHRDRHDRRDQGRDRPPFPGPDHQPGQRDPAHADRRVHRRRRDRRRGVDPARPGVPARPQLGPGHRDGAVRRGHAGYLRRARHPDRRAGADLGGRGLAGRPDRGGVPVAPRLRRVLPAGPGVIEVDRLSKRFGPVTAVDDLSFTVRPGRVTGFLGPNGAGKSTTMRVILGLDAPTSGRALVGGRRYTGLIRPLREVGSLLDATALHGGRTGWAHLLSLAQSNGISRRRVTEVLALTGLAGVAQRRVGGYSLGMKQRLGIAAALLGDPPVLMFDEPVNGLDPEGIRWIRGFFGELAGQGRTVLVSSHLMSEMALTAEHLIIIGRGRLLADLPTAQLIGSDARQDVLVRSPRADELTRLITGPGRTVTRQGDGDLVVTGLDAAAIGELAAGHGLPLHALIPRQASLEEAYLDLTGESTDYRGERTTS
jgi:ABC-2 type transport system ATP-binding protein